MSDLYNIKLISLVLIFFSQIQTSVYANDAFVFEDVFLDTASKNSNNAIVLMKGQVQNSCTEISAVTLGHQIYPDNRIIILADFIHEDRAICQKISRDILRQVELGYLSQGAYTIEVYENDTLSISKEIEIN